MTAITDQDDGSGGTKNSTNREYGGIVDKLGHVIQAKPGSVTTPSQGATMSIPTDENTRTIFHSRPSGRSGNTAYGQAPSPDDVSGAGRSSNYVFGRFSGLVYIYNNSGVQATMPISRFKEIK